MDLGWSMSEIAVANGRLEALPCRVVVLPGVR